MLLKGIFDIVVAFTSLVVFGPILILVALVILIFDGFPILFVQKRLTKHASQFHIFKFRTMNPDFDKEKVGIQVKGGSSSITKIGAILRKLKLDELPQLLNIIMGKMSFVGPRPELPRRLEHYSDRLLKSFDIKSGITSPASIIFSDEEYILQQVEDAEAFYIRNLLPLKAELNIIYAKERSFWGDLQLIFDTVYTGRRQAVIERYAKEPDLIGKIERVRRGENVY